jgi:hypothetical protein
MQLVIFPGDVYVFATHADEQDLTGLYPALDVEGVRRPAAEIIRVARDQVFTYDADGRMLDPRHAPQT